jgi:hypothetical protein
MGRRGRTSARVGPDWCRPIGPQRRHMRSKRTPQVPTTDTRSTVHFDRGFDAHAELPSDEGGSCLNREPRCTSSAGQPAWPREDLDPKSRRPGATRAGSATYMSGPRLRARAEALITSTRLYDHAVVLPVRDHRHRQRWCWRPSPPDQRWRLYLTQLCPASSSRASSAAMGPTSPSSAPCSRAGPSVPGTSPMARLRRPTPTATPTACSTSATAAPPPSSLATTPGPTPVSNPC